MPPKNETHLHMVDVRLAFLEEAAELFDKNSDRISNLANGAEDGKCRIGFRLIIDISENEPLVSVEISGGQRFKDKRARTLQNPNQTTLFDRDNKPAIIDVSRYGNGHTEPETAIEATESTGRVVSFEEAKENAREAQEKRKKGRKKKQSEEAVAE